jgi:hypothetical protein
MYQAESPAASNDIAYSTFMHKPARTSTRCLARATLTATILTAAAVAGCGSSPTRNVAAASAPAPQPVSPITAQPVSPITAQTKFEDLRDIAQTKAKAAKWATHDMVEDGLPLLIAFTRTIDGATTGSSGFQQWCTLQGGNMDWGSQEAAKALIASKNKGGYGYSVAGCSVSGNQFGYAVAWWMNNYRQVWLDSATMKGAVSVIASQKAQAESDAFLRWEATKKTEERRLAFIKASKPGTTLTCSGSELAQRMSAPISKSKLDCGSIDSSMEELISNGWAVTSHIARPDGDYGGIARTRFDFFFRKG